jgi:hypothetical protein
MKSKCTKFLAALFMLSSLSLSAAVRINEVRIDNFGADTDEYAELKGNPGESMDGMWYLQIGDHSGDGATKGSGVVEFAISLDGEVIGDSGYYLIGNTNMTLIDPANIDYFIGENSFENSDNITHLIVIDYEGSEVTAQADQLGDLAVDIDDDDDGVPNAVLPWASIVDAVGFVEDPEAGEWFYGEALDFVDVGPDGNFVPAHIYRYEDTGEWNIGSIDFDDMTDTVLTANPSAPTVPAIESFSTNTPFVGDTLTITGERFSSVSSVTIAGESVSFAIISDTEIEATVPDAEYGPVEVTSSSGSDVSFLNVIILDDNTIMAIEENFDAQDSTGVFTAFSVSSGLDWTWGSFDENGYVSMNGYANGDEPASEDWLVSPAIDLSLLDGAGLHFQTAANFSGPDLEVLISTDYDGTSTPETGFTWIPLTGTN